MNYKKKVFFFILFLLSTISFSSWAQPYVRIEELNQDVAYYDNTYGRIMDYYYNPTIKLYADEECTVPYTTTTDLDVIIEESYYNGYHDAPELCSSGTASYNVTVPSGNASYALYEGFHTKYATWDMGYDSNYNIERLWSCFQSYSVLPGSGYEASPSVQRPYFEGAAYNALWSVPYVFYREYEPD